MRVSGFDKVYETVERDAVCALAQQRVARALVREPSVLLLRTSG